jgi:hypothetical protein
MKPQKNSLVVTAVLLALASTGISSALAQSAQSPVIGFKDLQVRGACNCYFSRDCDAGRCDYFGCTLQGDNDGTCTTDFVKSLPPLLPAVDLYFQAYLASARGGGISPDIDLVRQAQAIPLAANEHLVALTIVHTALDLVLGFDFIRPQACLATPGGPGEIAVGALGQFRFAKTKSAHATEMPVAALEAIEAAQAAVVSAMRSPNPALVVEPLQSFWRKHPTYAPRHTGRCYHHGHANMSYRTPEECQIDELQIMLRVLSGQPR